MDLRDTTMATTNVFLFFIICLLIAILLVVAEILVQL